MNFNFSRIGTVVRRVVLPAFAASLTRQAIAGFVGGPVAGALGFVVAEHAGHLAFENTNTAYNKAQDAYKQYNLYRYNTEMQRVLARYNSDERVEADYVMINPVTPRV